METKGHLWYLRYPIEGKTFDANDPSTFIVVATTRPETMLGDVARRGASAERRALKHLIGKNAILPLVGRRIPIVGDEYRRSGKGIGRGEDHAGARLQRFRNRQATQYVAN